jgi:predicted MFS family arabinose efflux permease
VGLLPQIAQGLSVSEADVGLLLTSYAVVAGLTTIPLTAITMGISRHLLVAGTVAAFAVSQLAAAFAPTFLVLMLARLILCPGARDLLVAFQVGIGGGALLGERFVRAGLLGVLPALAAVLALLAGVIILIARQTFPVRAPAGEPVPAR